MKHLSFIVIAILAVVGLYQAGAFLVGVWNGPPDPGYERLWLSCARFGGCIAVMIGALCAFFVWLGFCINRWRL